MGFVNGKLQDGYPDNIGRRYAFCGDWNGPASYSQATGDKVTLPQFQNYIDKLDGSVSVSGTYFVRAFPSAAGPRSGWVLHWYVLATGSEVNNATNLSAEVVKLSGFGGSF